MQKRRNSWSSRGKELFLKAILLLSAVTLSVIFPSGESAAAVPKIAAGYDHAVAIQSDGSLWTWGANSLGQIGDGTTSNRLSPYRIDVGAEWSDIAAGKFYTLAVRSDGTLWAWGANNYGQLGDGTIVNRFAPVQIGTDADWAAVSAGTVHSLALKTNGTLWAWGRNVSGQIGDGTKTDRYAPVPIGTAAEWIAIAAGTSHSLAIRSDGTLWAWGANDLGQLGDGTTIQHSVPVHVGTETDWASIDGGDKYTLAIKTDGSLWAWGYDRSFVPYGSVPNLPGRPYRRTQATRWASRPTGPSGQRAKIRAASWGTERPCIVSLPFRSVRGRNGRLLPQGRTIPWLSLLMVGSGHGEAMSMAS